MNFRQRVAWLLLFLYLSVSCAVVYYIFEISEQYNVLALDHINTHHTAASAQHSPSIFSHVTHLSHAPFILWLIILLIPYLQVFCILYALTRSEPKLFCVFTLPLLCWRQHAHQRHEVRVVLDKSGPDIKSKLFRGSVDSAAHDSTNGSSSHLVSRSNGDVPGHSAVISMPHVPPDIT